MTTSTVHYSFTQPTNAGSSNVWGTLLNNDLAQIDTAIWNSSFGTTIGVNLISSATSVTLTNPVNNIQNVNYSAGSQKLILPAMNATASMVVGGNLIVNNTGTNAFQIVANDGTTNVLTSLLAGQTTTLTLLTNSTANGTFLTTTPIIPGTAASFTTLSASGAVTFSSTLGVTGNTTIGGTLGVTGASTFNSTMEVDGNFTVNTNKFIVSASNGNSSVAGTLAITGAITPTGGIVGTTTNDNAAAGNVGEFISSDVPSGSAISLTTNTPANITSISLTAGDWDVWGSEFGVTGSGTVLIEFDAALSTVSATFPIASNGGGFTRWIGSATQQNIGVYAGMMRLSLSVTTTVYLVTQASFTVSTYAAYGFIGARRVR